VDGPLELYSKSSDHGASPEQRAVGKVAEEEQMYPQRMVRQALRLGLVVTLVALALVVAAVLRTEQRRLPP
jgi:hypothetical protein